MHCELWHYMEVIGQFQAPTLFVLMQEAAGTR